MSERGDISLSVVVECETPTTGSNWVSCSHVSRIAEFREEFIVAWLLGRGSAER